MPNPHHPTPPTRQAPHIPKCLHLPYQPTNQPTHHATDQPTRSLGTATARRVLELVKMMQTLRDAEVMVFMQHSFPRMFDNMQADEVRGGGGPAGPPGGGV